MRNDDERGAFRDGYGLLTAAVLHQMRREYNWFATCLVYAPPSRPRYTFDTLPPFRIRAGARAFAAVATFNFGWWASWAGAPIRRAQLRPCRFKAATVVYDRALHPLDFEVEIDAE